MTETTTTRAATFHIYATTHPAILREFPAGTPVYAHRDRSGRIVARVQGSGFQQWVNDSSLADVVPPRPRKTHAA